MSEVTKQLHQRKRSDQSLSDEYETPQEVYDQLCYGYAIFPKLDVAASLANSKCENCIIMSEDALTNDWITPLESDPVDVWCNPPHSMTEKFVRKAVQQWAKYNMNIMMIIPANSICTKYAKECIEPHAEYHPIFFRPKFLRDGKPSDDPSRNSYFVVIWRKRNGAKRL